MQIALEPELRRELHVLAAQSDSSIKDWIADRLSSVERRDSLGGYLVSQLGRPLVLAPPANADRFNLRLDDPRLEAAIDELATGLQRTRPQILYTLLVCLVQDAMSVTTAEPLRRQA